jgi:bacteriocin-like protein
MKTLNEQELNLVSGGEISGDDLWIGGLCVATFAVGILATVTMAPVIAVAIGIAGLVGDGIAIEGALE